MTRFADSIAAAGCCCRSYCCGRSHTHPLMLRPLVHSRACSVSFGAFALLQLRYLESKVKDLEKEVTAKTLLMDQVINTGSTSKCDGTRACSCQVHSFHTHTHTHRRRLRHTHRRRLRHTNTHTQTHRHTHTHTDADTQTFTNQD